MVKRLAPAEGVEPGEDGDERVVGSLHGQVVQFFAADTGEDRPGAGRLEAGGPQQQPVQPADGQLPRLAGGRQRRQPALRIVEGDCPPSSPVES